MANRIVLGTQTGYTVGGQFEQGLFISRPGQDVTAAANAGSIVISLLLLNCPKSKLTIIIY